MPNDSLRGHVFVATTYTVELSGGTITSPVPRVCGACFYRDSPRDGGDCSHPDAKQAFGMGGHWLGRLISGSVRWLGRLFNVRWIWVGRLFSNPWWGFMPRQMEDKEVGHYCPHHLDFDAE